MKRLHIAGLLIAMIVMTSGIGYASDVSHVPKSQCLVEKSTNDCVVIQFNMLKAPHDYFAVERFNLVTGETALVLQNVKALETDKTIAVPSASIPDRPRLITDKNWRCTDKETSFKYQNVQRYYS